MAQSRTTFERVQELKLRFEHETELAFCVKVVINS